MKDPLVTAYKREQRKHHVYKKLAEQDNAKFIPLVLETYGGFGTEFDAFINKLSAQISESSNHNNQESLSQLYYCRCAIAVALQKGNANIAMMSIKQAIMSHRSRNLLTLHTRPPSHISHTQSTHTQHIHSPTPTRRMAINI